MLSVLSLYSENVSLVSILEESVSSLNNIIIFCASKVVEELDKKGRLALLSVEFFFSFFYRRKM